MILQIKFVTFPIVCPQSRTDSWELQKTTLKGLKDLTANKERITKQISEFEIYIYYPELPWEENFNMGDEALLDMSVAIDLYSTYPCRV